MTLGIMVVYLIIVLAIGIVVSKKAGETTDDYWVAGRTVSTRINSFAIMATIASGGTFLGSIGYMLKNGIALWFTLWGGVIIGLVFASLFVAKQLVVANVSTVPEFLYKRYDSKFISILTPVVIALGLTVYLVSQYTAGAYIMQTVLGIPYKQGLIVAVAVFVLYTLLGGMYAVTWTDFIQGLMMFFVFGALVIGVFTTISGPWAIVQGAVTKDPKLGTINAPWITYFGGFLQNVCAWTVIPHTVMRIFSSRDHKTAVKSLNWGMLICGITVLYGLWLVSAVTVKEFIPAEVDRALLVLMQNVSPIILGVGSATILAAVMSSTDGMMLGAAAAVSQDLFKHVIKPNATDKEVIWAARITIGVIGLVTLILALNPPPLIVHLYQLVLGFLSSALFMPLVLGIWWKKANNTGAISGIIAGAFLFLVVQLGMTAPAYTAAVVGIFGSLIATIIGSQFGEPPSEKVLETVQSWHDYA